MEVSPVAPLLFFRSSVNDTFFSLVPPPPPPDVVVTVFPTTETPGGGVILDNCFPFPLLLAPLLPPGVAVVVVVVDFAEVGVVADNILLVFSVGSIFPELLLVAAVAVDGPPFPPPFIAVVVAPFIIVEEEDDPLLSLSLGRVSTAVLASPSNGIEYQFDPNKKEASPSHPLLLLEEVPPSIIIF